jgi:DNA-binding FadR family transcriptional regulator
LLGDNDMPQKKPALLMDEIIRPRKIYEEISTRIESKILAGTLAAGDQLPSERELMASFGVGRTSIREALFALQKMGLIAIRSGERARVVAPSVNGLMGELAGAARYLLVQPNGVTTFQEARMFFEVGLVRHAAGNATAKQIARLALALECNERTIDRPLEFQETDVAFHYILAEIPGNSIFVSLHSAIVEWLVEQRSTSMLVKGSRRKAYNAHAKIYQRVAAHDVDGAEAAMREHLVTVGQLYWKAKKC